MLTTILNYQTSVNIPSLSILRPKFYITIHIGLVHCLSVLTIIIGTSLNSLQKVSVLGTLKGIQILSYISQKIVYD